MGTKYRFSEFEFYNDDWSLCFGMLLCHCTIDMMHKYAFLPSIYLLLSNEVKTPLLPIKKYRNFPVSSIVSKFGPQVYIVFF